MYQNDVGFIMFHHFSSITCYFTHHSFTFCFNFYNKNGLCPMSLKWSQVMFQLRDFLCSFPWSWVYLFIICLIPFFYVGKLVRSRLGKGSSCETREVLRRVWTLVLWGSLTFSVFQPFCVWVSKDLLRVKVERSNSLHSKSQCVQF